MQAHAQPIVHDAAELARRDQGRAYLGLPRRLPPPPLHAPPENAPSEKGGGSPVVPRSDVQRGFRLIGALLALADAALIALLVIAGFRMAGCAAPARTDIAGARSEVRHRTDAPTTRLRVRVATPPTPTAKEGGAPSDPPTSSRP